MPRRSTTRETKLDTDLASRLDVVVDHKAEPGDVLGALAELLLDLAERDAPEVTPGRLSRPLKASAEPDLTPWPEGFPMRGVRCSWVDMEKIRQALSAGERGDQKALQRMRCVDTSTVSRWKAACEMMDTVEGKVAISQLSHFQPSHATELARHFRKTGGNDWTEKTRLKIAEWVDRCEAEGWTVQQLRLALGASACEDEGIAEEPDGGEAALHEESQGRPRVIFNWLGEMKAIHAWLIKRRGRFPGTNRQGFTDLVRRILERMDAEDAGNGGWRQAACDRKSQSA
jgi:hypothetical protein